MNRQAARHLNTAILLWTVMVLPFATASIDAGQPIDSEFADDEVSSAEDRGSDAWLRLLVTYYDSEGNFGLMTNFGLSFTGRYLEYQFASEDTVHIGGSRTLNEGTSRSIGAPYAFRTFTEEYGSIMGFSRVVASGAPYARFTVPVPASSLGLTNGPSKEPFGGTPQTGHGTGIGTADSTFVADDRNVPSTALPVALVPNGAGRVPALTAEYLNGNASHETVGQEIASFPQGWFQIDGSWFVAWGYEETHAPFVIYIPSHNPLGPIRGTFSFTGYSADTVEWIAEDLYSVNWIPLLSAIPGSVDSPSPSEILDLNSLGVLEGAFILEPAIREKLLGQSELFTNLKAASDLNQDCVLDAADFIPLQAGE